MKCDMHSGSHRRKHSYCDTGIAIPTIAMQIGQWNVNHILILQADLTTGVNFTEFKSLRHSYRPGAKKNFPEEFRPSHYLVW